jgi:hypothetical protein
MLLSGKRIFQIPGGSSPSVALGKASPSVFPSRSGERNTRDVRCGAAQPMSYITPIVIPSYVTFSCPSVTPVLHYHLSHCRAVGSSAEGSSESPHGFPSFLCKAFEGDDWKLSGFLESGRQGLSRIGVQLLVERSQSTPTFLVHFDCSYV